MKANAQVLGGHAYIDVHGDYGPVANLTRIEAEALIRELRKACDDAEAHNRGIRDITKERL